MKVKVYDVDATTGQIGWLTAAEYTDVRQLEETSTGCAKIRTDLEERTIDLKYHHLEVYFDAKFR